MVHVFLYWCFGQKIDWNLIVDLYRRNAGAITSTPGLCLVHKIKHEHVNLTNFSKMRVDLAAQVCVCVSVCIIIDTTIDFFPLGTE